jgi:hypothetical protein
MPRNVKLAVLLAFLLHGAFILSAQYRLSYDAYNHIFFADHYLRDWWSLWDRAGTPGLRSSLTRRWSIKSSPCLPA